jgi:hypothetical protein
LKGKWHEFLLFFDKKIILKNYIDYNLIVRYKNRVSLQKRETQTNEGVRNEKEFFKLSSIRCY